MLRSLAQRLHLCNLFFSFFFLFFSFFYFFKLVLRYAIAQRMKDCVLLLCLAITMTPRLNHVRSSDTLAVVEMPITSLLRRIATTSAEKVRLYFVRHTDKAIQIPVRGTHSVLLLTLACYKCMLFAFQTAYFQRQGKLRCNTKSF